MRLILGDCLDKLKDLPDNSVSSVVCDPPYGLSFMNKKWDYDVPSTEIWTECLRVLKPGGHLLSFGGSRTYHRMAVRIEDAGFEIRDQIMWIYGSGFPKSHNIGKAVDKLMGNEREVVGKVREGRKTEDCYSGNLGTDADITKGQSEWEGWGTALKPAHEPIVVARKPLSEKSVALNVLKWGTGGMNIDVSRVGTEQIKSNNYLDGTFDPKGNLNGLSQTGKEYNTVTHEGRWPANIILDEEAGAVLDEQSGESKSQSFTAPMRDIRGNGDNLYTSASGNKRKVRDIITTNGYNDKGGASRYFYCPKTSKKDRDEGTNDLYLCENNLIWEIETLNQLLKDISADMIKIPEDNEWNTILSGNNITDQYQQGFKYTTSIILKMIIGLTTLNYYPHLNTKDYIVDVIKMIKVNGLNLVDYVEQINLFKQNITNEKMEYLLGVVSAVLPTLLEINKKGKTGNFHATVKPTSLMEYLIKLVTPVNGTVLDPFMGSGSTGKAAVRNGYDFIGIEREEEYLKIAQARIENENKII